ncbi:Rab3 GTPase-activating protein catalytic subunit [Phytophthora pseudosyringae]|uniref:Rab3 GTPase-activating protein catalytic subunit n=1 Tax=Phytophthora pseudosyringae TaxID=221518 RepID=A0A8T1VGX1_9STRA|nr:Rab3 GTPase-activating protein catalytic subunit [Phytophthora pseudosyringae]
MQVEEDPSSQFVDFTNATAAEQFVSDAEQALIGWQLANKGHASLEALASASPSAPDRVWTKELQFHATPAPRSYALSLFVARRQELPPAGSARASRKLKQWQEGLEHFTPTMLAVADASRDFQWGVEGDAEAVDAHVEEDEEGQQPPSVVSYDSSVFEDEAGGRVLSRKAAFTHVQKWFGVDEFLLLSRSSPPAAKRQEQQATGSSAAGKTGKEETEEKDSGEKSGEEAGEQEEEDEDAMPNIQVDQNEAGMLLSALTIALNNCNCTVPAFVPVFEPSRGTWIGSAVPGATGNVSMSFETDSVPELNPNQSCISGLLDFFKLKLQLSPQVEERCRVQADESGDLAIGMMVSASFGFSWDRKDDPREVVTPENALAWRTLESQLRTKDQHQIRQITEKLFGESHPTPLHGASTTPLDGMDLTASWPQLREGTYVDNVVHSTLDPSSAPQWMLSVRFQELRAENQRKPQLPLSKQMANLVQVYSNSRELNKDILVSELAPPMPVAPSPPKPQAVATASIAGGSREEATTQPSPVLPESIPAARGAAVVLGNAISSLVSAATWKGSDVEEIRRIVSELFDEAGDGGGDESGDRSSGIKGNSGVSLTTMPSSVEHGAPLGELVSILATRMAQLHGINSMSLLWVEFVKALRERWFQQQLLPFMSTSTKEGGGDHNTSSHSLDALFLLDSDAMHLPPPDFRHCLLHQKLQLLNCCILREAQESKPRSSAGDGIKPGHIRQGSSDTDTSAAHNTATNGEEDGGEGEADGSPSDDEFFDSIEQDSASLSSPPRATRRPEGVLREAAGVVCLQTNKPLLEPVSQTAVPMTEDVAKQQQDLLTRLGVSVESDKLRQQIQSTTLISDMQAFKAANPQCCLTDFIRWYSPKDWIPFTTPIDAAQTELPQEGRGVWWFEKHGMLSERMRFGPGHEHIWQQMWETSASVPASRQKRLFDPVQESEKVYHYMETLSPHELFHQMLAGAISSSVFALETSLPVHASSDSLPVVHRALKNLRSRGNRSIALLDDALAESQVAFPAAGRSKQQRGDGHEQSIAAAHQDQQLQVAFEMALDACWKLVRSLESVEAMVTKALALFRYFPVTKEERASLELVNLLLLPTLSHRQQVEISELLKQESLRQQITTLVLTNPTLAEAGPMAVPVQREYVLRCICPRPFLREYYGDSAFDEEDDEASITQPDQELEESPLVVCRMYAAFKKSTVRFALVLGESEF